MKLGKELKLNLSDNYKTKIGTVNNKDSKSLYISLSAWGQINEYDENKNYRSFLNGLRKNIRTSISRTINENYFYNSKYIVDLDMRTSGFNPIKRSFMSCELTLYQKKYLPINDKNILNNSKRILYSVLDVIDKNEYFTFYKTKKKKDIPLPIDGEQLNLFQHRFIK